MNYKIRITAENHAIIKRIADENGMNPYNFEFHITESFYIIKDDKFYVGNIGYNEIVFSNYPEITTEQFIKLFDKKETELDKWLRETKAKKLKANELWNEIARLPMDISKLLEGDSITNKTHYLLTEWNNPTEESPKVETEWQPKRGDRVLVWDDSEKNASELIFVTKIEGHNTPIVVVTSMCEKNFLDGKGFDTIEYLHMKPIPTEQPKEDKVAEVAYQYCKKLGFNNTSHTANIIQSFIDGTKWQSEQPKETDFKSKVIELIEKRIEDNNYWIDKNIIDKNYSYAHARQSIKADLKDLLNQIKQL
jgi:hypothetical protein